MDADVVGDFVFELVGEDVWDELTEAVALTDADGLSEIVFVGVGVDDFVAEPVVDGLDEAVIEGLIVIV